MEDRYAKWRWNFEQTFRQAKPDPATKQVETSPSGNFVLETVEYVVPASSWRYSRGLVSATVDRALVADVRRNHVQFWHAWVEHPNGSEYLLCGEDYQGQTVINLSERKRTNHFPDAGFSGNAFCWAAAYPSPNCALLAVDGCYWACPYEIVVMDFSEPESLPYREIARFPAPWEWKGWIDNTTLEYIAAVDVRKSDGVPYEQLSELEQAQLDQDSKRIETVHEIRRFNVPAAGPRR